MDKDRTPYSPPIRTRRGIPLPAWLDRLSARVARWPWWAIMSGVGLIAAFYSLATSDLYRRVLVFVTKDPRIITDQFVNVVYEVQDSEGATRRVSGVLTSQTADSVTVITQAEERVSIPRDDLVKQTCDSPAADGDCPINQPVSVSRRSIDGTLIFEDLGKYQIKTALGETVDVRKFTVARDQGNKLQEVRTPPGCSANPDGGCSVKLALKPDAPENEIKGILLESTPTHLLVQTVPPVSVTIPKASIVNVVDFTPAQCALNNVIACNQGIFLTITVTLTAYLAAMLIGLIFGLMRVSTNRVLFNLSTIYVEVVRGVPLLVILLFTNYVFAPWFRDNFPTYAPAMRIALAVGGLAILAYYVLTRWSRRFTDPLDLIQPIGVTAVFSCC
jgi:His/Glu/Gln/Arg/opine family amino acid ABC transporter permease subunit